MNKIKKFLKKSFFNPLISLPKSFSDRRGFIQPICDFETKNTSLIYCKKKTWRANHYHKKDWHFIYVLNGSFEYYYRKTNTNTKVIKKIITKGQLLFTGPMVDHAMFYLTKTNIIVMSKNPRDQKTYENDTVRIDFMNNDRRF